MSSLSVLIVEDEIIIGWALKERLVQLGHRVLSVVSSADKAVALARTDTPDLIIMDIMLKGTRTGIDAARDIRTFSDLPIVYLSGNIHLLSQEQTEATRPLGIYSKPPSDGELSAMCEAAQAALRSPATPKNPSH